MPPVQLKKMIHKDGQPTQVYERLAAGSAAGVISQTTVYPMEVSWTYRGLCVCVCVCIVFCVCCVCVLLCVCCVCVHACVHVLGVCTIVLSEYNLIEDYQSKCIPCVS